jgi:formate dehydrogenase subunit gamma
MIDSGELLPNGRVVRYGFRERMIHWTAGFSYLYLMLTGLAFWTPWLFWIATVLGGGSISRMLHPWVGLGFVFAGVLMYGMWAPAMHENESDKAWWNAIGHYIRNEDEEVPPVGRFNGGQKLLFWGFFFCGILLLLSGIVLWLPQDFPHIVRLAAIFVHASAAMLTIGLFMIHVYMGAVLETGALDSVIRGDVSSGFAKEHHRLWFDKIVGDSSARR